MRYAGYPILLAALTLSCDLAVPTTNVCYGEHVVPLIKDDCAICHGNGEYRVRLQGLPEDYDELLSYIAPFDPERSSILTWAEGSVGVHPPIWLSTNERYKTVSAWISEGASRECFDHEASGECRRDEDCAPVTCLCPDGEEHVASICTMDSDTARGTCMRRTDCIEPSYGLCEASADGDADGDVDGDADADGDADGDVESDADEGDGIVSFENDIVTILRWDCASCHYNGGWNVRLRGDVSDYDEVMRYVDLEDPEGTGSFLWWAAGGRRHPISWPRGGDDYNLFLEWVLQGALFN